MLHLCSLQIKTEQLAAGTTAKIIQTPEQSYEALARDFKLATHFKQIDEVPLKNAKGIIIEAENVSDGYFAALYLYKKYMACNIDMLQIDNEEDYVMDAGELCDDVFRERWSTDQTYVHLPIIELHDYCDSLMPYSFHHTDEDEDEHKTTNYYWHDLSAPLILVNNQSFTPRISSVLQKENHFIIMIQTMSLQDSWHSFEKQNLHDILFDCDFEYCTITKPSNEYLHTLLQHLLEQQQIDYDPSIDFTKISETLVQYRKQQFKGLFDLEKLIEKARRYANGEQLTTAHFMQFFAPTFSSSRQTSSKEQLAQLIGLDEVKKQINRSIQKLKLAKIRKDAGYAQSDIHLAAAFLGSPGTAKTTVARLFAKTLLEENLLTNPVFKEVTRKDLIGQFVGWTAPQVAKVFEEAKGGTIFIDEAYALLDDTNGYSAEACAALVEQMENNPDTLVIFAGYTSEMQRFLQYANVGLCSRITTVIEFQDYNANQLMQIFYSLAQQQGFQIEQREQVRSLLHHFIINMSRFKHTGNGRLMRKLLTTAIGYLAEREPKNVNLLLSNDIQAACSELLKAEQLMYNASPKAAIGFIK